MKNLKRTYRRRGYRKPKLFQSTKTDLKQLASNQTKLIKKVQKIAKEPEIKHYYDQQVLSTSTYFQTTLSYSSGVFQVKNIVSLLNVPQGDGADERVGSSIKAKYINIKFFIDSIDTTVTNFNYRCRVLLVWDREGDSSTGFVPSELFGNMGGFINVLSKTQPLNRKRFKVMMDKMFVVNPVASSQTTGKDKITFTYKKNLNEKKIQFEDTSSVNQHGALYLLWFSEQDNRAQLAWNSELGYIDS